MKSVLPAEEFLHPLPLAAVVLMAVNDRVLKGSGWCPGWLTGKLSDVAGVFFFPVLCTALVRVLASAALRRRVALTRPMLVVAMGLTAALMLLLELSPGFVAWFETTTPTLDPLGAIGRVRSTMDVTDLFTLPVLALTWLHARRFVAAGGAQKPPMET